MFIQPKIQLRLHHFVGNFMLYKFCYYQFCSKLLHFPIKLEKRKLSHINQCILFRRNHCFSFFILVIRGANVAPTGALEIANWYW